ncbi:MAG: universal stress protein [Gammaproteobacteria bacterium]|nr:universal stress protein [Gammaproteobacteria bacterium]
MTKARRILVVVDPAAAEHPAVARGASVARRLGLELRLLVCVHGGLPSRMPRGADAQEVRRALLRQHLRLLQQLAQDCAGVEVTMNAVWDRPLHEAIIRETLRSEPQLVMKESRYHPTISRALVTNTDWHLIRDCPAPLWLVRGPAWEEAPRVVAFVDPTHEHDKPADLDHRILAEATALATGLGGEAHAVHCHDGSALFAAAGGPGVSAEIEALGAELQAEHAGRLRELATARGIDPARTQLRSGRPAEAIPATVRQLGAHLAVMGAVARSRLQDIVLGSTAEQVLDQLPCDVLVVKPGRFESPVTYRAQAADFMELH